MQENMAKNLVINEVVVVIISSFEFVCAFLGVLSRQLKVTHREARKKVETHRERESSKENFLLDFPILSYLSYTQIKAE
jgi:hypothetical protein